MLWQEAVQKSSYKVATRVGKTGEIMRRDQSGEVLVYHTDGYIEVVEASRIEGFSDWEPLK